MQIFEYIIFMNDKSQKRNVFDSLLKNTSYINNALFEIINNTNKIDKFITPIVNITKLNINQ